MKIEEGAVSHEQSVEGLCIVLLEAAASNTAFERSEFLLWNLGRVIDLIISTLSGSTGTWSKKYHTASRCHRFGLFAASVYQNCICPTSHFSCRLFYRKLGFWPSMIHLERVSVSNLVISGSNPYIGQYPWISFLLNSCRHWANKTSSSSTCHPRKCVKTLTLRP